MADLSVVTSSRTGATFAPVSASAGGDTFTNTGQEIFYVKNASAGSITVTFTTQGSVDGDLAIPDRDVTVAASQEKLVGPFPTGVYNNPSTGKVEVSYSASASVTVGVLKTGAL